MSSIVNFEIEPPRVPQKTNRQPVTNPREAEQQHLANVSALADYDRADEIEEQLKKNHDFVQFTRKGLTKLSKLKSALASSVFLFLSKEMDRENKLMISQGTLAEIMEVSRQSVNTAIRELVDNQLIEVLKVGSQSVYCLNANVVWTRERDKLHLARFKANIIVSKEEQTQSAKVRKTNMKQISLKLDAS